MKRFVARWVYGRTGGMRHALLSWQLALLIVLVLNGVAAYFALGLRFNNSPEIYYPADAPAVMLRDDLRREFPSDEALTVLFHGDDLYGADFLRRLDGLVRVLQDHPLVDRVTAVTTLERISGTGDSFTVERLVDASRLGQATPEALKARVLGDRFAPGTLASRDGNYLALAVRPRPLTESSQRLEVKVAVAAAINNAGLRPYFAGDAGPVTMDVAQLASILQDTVHFLPLTVAIALGLLWWVVGRWRPVAIGTFAMSTVVLPVIAGLVASGQPYTMATAILPSLLAAYTVATLLHFYAGVQRAQRASTCRDEIVDRALADTRKPSAFNVLTTGAGLLSLLLVPIPPIQVFGVAGALGTALVFVVVQWIVPPILRRWDGKPWPARRSGMGRLGHLARRLALLSVRWPKTVVVALVALVVLLWPYVRQVEVETDMLTFFAPTHPINVDTRRIEAALSGVTTLEISLRGRERDTFQNLATLRELKRFQDWLQTRPEVDRTISMADLVEEMNWAMNGERPAFRTLPGNERLLRQYLLIYDGEDLYELVNREYDHARMVVNLNVHGTSEIRRVIDEIRSELTRQPLAGLEVDIGGYGRLLTDQVDLLVQGQVHSFAGAFGQIFLIMVLLWRSVKSAALCMAPNLAPLFFIFVLMGAAGIHLDSATVMIASVVLGITVDDTIHLHHAYEERLRRGLSPLWVTAVGLLAGLIFEVLLLPALLLLTAGLPWTWRSALGLRRGRGGARELGPSRLHTPAPPLPLADIEPTAPVVERRVLVCHGDKCKSAGAARIWRRLRNEQGRIAEAQPELGLRLTKTSCLGPCRFAPVVQIYPEGTAYGLLDDVRLDTVIDEHLRASRPVRRWALPALGTSPKR